MTFYKNGNQCTVKIRDRYFCHLSSFQIDTVTCVCRRSTLHRAVESIPNVAGRFGFRRRALRTQGVVDYTAVELVKSD